MEAIPHTVLRIPQTSQHTRDGQAGSVLPALDGSSLDFSFLGVHSGMSQTVRNKHQRREAEGVDNGLETLVCIALIVIVVVLTLRTAPLSAQFNLRTGTTGDDASGGHRSTTEKTACSRNKEA